MVSNLGLFCLATYLATFQKIGQFFSKSSVACTINIYDRKFYDRKLRSSLERKLRS